MKKSAEQIKKEAQELVKEYQLEVGTHFQIEILKDGSVNHRSADSEYLSDEAVSSVFLYDYEDIEEAIEDLAESVYDI